MSNDRELLELAAEPVRDKYGGGDEWVDQFARAVEAEREACAKLAENTVCDVHLPTGIKIYGHVAARAIRARGAA